MKSEDNQEAIRLCAALRDLNGTLDGSNALASEALKKAALAISLSFAHGFRESIESLYDSIDAPLSPNEKAELGSLGLNPENEK